MPGISRRSFLENGLAISASSLVARSAWARSAVLVADYPRVPSAEALSAVAPRERLLFDFGWRFTLGHGSDPARDLGFGADQGDFAKMGYFAFALVGYNDSKWRTLNLPHDWAVELPFVRDEQLQSHGYKPLGRRFPETSVGWYRREFKVPASDAGRRVCVEFDGVFRSVLVFVNGCFVGRSDNGYAPFRFDITDFLALGTNNCITVRVDASFGDGWFYEGAGIYRHVWLTKTDPLHLVQWESTVRSHTAGSVAALSLGAKAVNQSEQPKTASLRWKIADAAGNTVATVDAAPQTIPAGETISFAASATVPDPAFWTVDSPILYTAILSVLSGEAVLDAERVSFGIRSAYFDPDRGFLLNGRQVKLQGTCNHQDHAGVGAAVPDSLQWYRLGLLREMGCNAVRTSHNMPAPEWVEACDRMGVMMMCETRQMSSSPEGLAQLETMVKRYRNSPSIILWSIGNEEMVLQDKEAEQGARIAATMVELCHRLDPTRAVSAAVNGDNSRGVSDPLDVIGFNYQLNAPDKYHQLHPKRPLYGSETSSALATRGCYVDDPLRNQVSIFDGKAPWGASAEEWWTYYATREWEAGGFAWTGFDYRGEPTPYGWPSINSQFGILDMCGFPKDPFYYYKAWWTKEPVLHILPHWNLAGREGDEVSVWAFSNLEEVELFLNGASLGRKKVPHLGHLEWKVRYEPGTVEARGFRDGQVVATERRETSGEAAQFQLSADRTEILADGEDVAVIRVEALDKEGRPVPTASSLIHFDVSGSGALIGVGNGDPNCQESDKEPRRSLFNGLAQVIVQSTRRPGEIHIEVAKEGWEGPELMPAKLVITTKPTEQRPSVPVRWRG